MTCLRLDTFRISLRGVQNQIYSTEILVVFEFVSINLFLFFRLCSNNFYRNLLCNLSCLFHKIRLSEPHKFSIVLALPVKRAYSSYRHPSHIRQAPLHKTNQLTEISDGGNSLSVFGPSYKRGCYAVAHRFASRRVLLTRVNGGRELL